MGNQTTANGDFSTAMGSGTDANGSNSIAMGVVSKSNGGISTTMGNYTQANGYASLVIGRYNDTIVSTQTSMQTTTPLFIVGNGTSSTVRSNALVVRNDGRVGIGISGPTHQLTLSTNSAAKPTSSSWTISSDARLKTVDGNYTRGLADVLKLNTVKYHYIKGNARNLPTEEQGYGFVAQELQQVYPEAVKQNEDGYLSVDFHPVLVSYINAIKELNTKVERLEKENDKLELLEKQNELLIKRIEALEKK
jgi:chaperonin cofactor prefoldin